MLEKKKRDQDMLIVSLKEEKKSLNRQIEILNGEVIPQTREYTEANSVLTEARTEHQKLKESKKNIINHLQKVFFKIVNKWRILSAFNV